MTELEKGINKIKEEMQDTAKEQTANYLLAVLARLKNKILFDFQGDEKKFKKGKITGDRLAIIEEQTFYFMENIDFWIDTIEK